MHEKISIFFPLYGFYETFAFQIDPKTIVETIQIVKNG
jgi:hypothetical protein